MTTPTDTLRRRLLAASVLGAAGLPGARAQGAWPNQTVKILVGFPGGSTPDVAARILAEPLAKALGQNVIVENKGGASGSIGAAAVAAAPPDGYTFAVVF